MLCIKSRSRRPSMVPVYFWIALKFNFLESVGSDVRHHWSTVKLMLKQRYFQFELGTYLLVKCYVYTVGQVARPFRPFRNCRIRRVCRVQSTTGDGFDLINSFLHVNSYSVPNTLICKLCLDFKVRTQP